MVYRLEEETEADWWEVEALYDLCFAPGRTALSSYRLRDGVPTGLVGAERTGSFLAHGRLCPAPNRTEALADVR